MLLCVATTPGCLLGPPVEGLPEEELYPPRIVLDQVDPPPRDIIVVETSELCEMMSFSLGRVIDENVDDELVVRWFLDWEGPGKSTGWINDRNVEVSGSAERTDPIALYFELTLSELIDPGRPHAITAVVADRTLLNTTGIGFAEDNEEGQYDWFQWTFVFANGGECDRYK